MNQDNVITNERVKILFGRAFSSISMVIVGVFIFAYIMREQIDSLVLLAWIGFMSITALVRYWILFDYNKNKQSTPSHNKFEKRYSYATGLVGMGWAFFIAMGLSLPTLEYRLYSLLLLTSIVALSVPVFSSSIKTTYFYITPSLIVSIPLLLSRGGDDAAIGLALIFFAVMVIRSSKEISNTLNAVLNSNFQIQKQTEKLKELGYEKSATEQLLQGIMDNSPTVIYVKSIDGRFTFVNQEFLNLFHLQREDTIGKTLHDIFPKETADQMRSSDLEVQESKKPLQYEETAPHDDGPRNYISIKFPLFDEAGILYAVGGVSTDITELFHIEESLDISQQRLLLHREQSPVGVIEWDTNFKFLDWNPAAQRIFGYKMEEVLGHHITERILPESAREAVDKVWSDLLANKGGTYSLNENITKDKRTILCEWHNTPLTDHNGNVIGVTSLVEDVTDRQKDEDSWRQTQKLESLSQLSAGIAHEINTPLQYVSDNISYISDAITSIDPILQEGHNLLEKVKSSETQLQASDFERLQKLYETADIDFLLEESSLAVAQSKYGMDQIKRIVLAMKEFSHPGEMRVMVDPNKAISNTLIVASNELKDIAELVTDFDEDLPKVFCIPSAINQVILNIVVNAAQAIASDSKDWGMGEITVSTAVDDDQVIIKIADSGPGMSEDVRNKIFDPFFTTRRVGKGTGQGLSIAHKIICEQHSGNLSVESKLGEGSCFTISLPFTETARSEQEGTAQIL